MKGISGHTPATVSGEDARWDELACDAVGNAIEFWGFKRNQGRVWALLYLRGVPMEAAALQRELKLSKGAVSMVTRELESWGVIRRVRGVGDATWRFEAETDLMAMIGRVFREREAAFTARVRADLEAAEGAARRTRGIDPEVLERLKRLRLLAQLGEKAINGFIRTAKFDVKRLASVLRRPGSLFGGDA